MKPKPQQSRAIKTRRKLMSALEDLLKEKSFTQITVVDIAKRAGVSSGILYSHFANKDAFLDALLEDYKIRVITRLEDVEAEDLLEEFRNQGGLRNTLHMIAKLAFAQISEEAHIIRAIVNFPKLQTEAEKAKWQKLRERAFETITPLLDVYQHELARPHNAQTAAMLVYFFNTIYAEALLIGDRETSIVSSLGESVFIQEVTDFAYGYLTTRPT